MHNIDSQSEKHSGIIIMLGLLLYLLQSAEAVFAGTGHPPPTTTLPTRATTTILPQLPTNAPTKHFTLNVSYVTVAPDGFEQQLMLANGQIDFPIVVNAGDNVVITVNNNLVTLSPSSALSLFYYYSLSIPPLPLLYYYSLSFSSPFPLFSLSFTTTLSLFLSLFSLSYIISLLSLSLSLSLSLFSFPCLSRLLLSLFLSLVLLSLSYKF
jgi:hypothetical protein